jgi:hypothetical protein
LAIRSRSTFRHPGRARIASDIELSDSVDLAALEATAGARGLEMLLLRFPRA